MKLSCHCSTYRCDSQLLFQLLSLCCMKPRGQEIVACWRRLQSRLPSFTHCALCQHWLHPWLHAVMLKLAPSTNSDFSNATGQIPQGCLFLFLHPALFSMFTSNTLQSALQDDGGNWGEGCGVNQGRSKDLWKPLVMNSSRYGWRLLPQTSGNYTMRD